jgi:hypothetical protein
MQFRRVQSRLNLLLVFIVADEVENGCEVNACEVKWRDKMQA